MNFTKHALLLFSIALFVNGCGDKVTDSDYLIKNVQIIDVEKGVVRANKSVAISGDKITGIYDGNVTVSDSIRVVDGSGKYLIPGLWDMHTHYNWNYSYFNPLLIANGVIGVREMWGIPDTIKSIRTRTAAGELFGPDVYSAGSIIDGVPPIWPGSSGVADSAEAIAEVRKQVTAGVDFLKVYSLLSRESYFAIVEEARKNEIPFAGHVPSSISMWEAIEAGQQSTEHLYGILEACTSNSGKLAELSLKGFSSPEKANFLVDDFDPSIFDSLITIMGKSNTWLSPTLVVLRNISNLDDSTIISDPRKEYVPSFFDQMWYSGASRSKEHFDAARRKFELHLSLMGDFEKAGVKILAGTDYPNPFCFPGFSLHDELELMVKGGMTNVGALRTATLNPAIFMKKEKEFGTIEKDKKASLVLLEGNPLEDINNVRRIEAVFLRGKYLDRSELDSLLNATKTLVSN